MGWGDLGVAGETVRGVRMTPDGPAPMLVGAFSPAEEMEMALTPVALEELWFTKPGTYAPRAATYIGIDGDEKGKTVMLKFSVPLRPDVPAGTATMCVRMSEVDATGLLANLLEAQQRGLLPQFATATDPKEVN